MSSDIEPQKHKPHDPPTIAVVAGQTLVRTCIVRFLKHELAGWDFLDTDSTEHLESARGKDVRLIALDMASRDVDSPGLRADLVMIGRHFPKAASVLLSNKDDVLAESRALEMGVRGYFTNSLPVEVALAGVSLVLAGGVFCPHPLATLQYGSATGAATASMARAASTENGERQMNGMARRDGHDGFTRREADVIAELRCGHSNKVIAENLSMSGNTVKMHLQHVMRKLRVQNRTEVVLLLGSKELVRQGAPASFEF
ncbi:response regulator transcription factor [Mesorhizobium sp. SP-1A]|uniref:helix-turn-helix transcriptional regulator n=1 Tax=Mesorhizobium sp. SP-1A TaxID=3077840 RepID=UPI0028F70574|nr:response regulator transcription factor [Mesorhizobium sp. SP-1A]